VTGVNWVVVEVDENNVNVDVNVETNSVVTGVNCVVVTVEETCVIVESNVEVEV